LWFVAWSLTVRVCGPAGRVPVGPEMVNPGPTDPLYAPAPPPATPTARAIARAAVAATLFGPKRRRGGRSRVILCTGRPIPARFSLDSRGVLAGLEARSRSGPKSANLQSLCARATSTSCSASARGSAGDLAAERDPSVGAVAAVQPDGGKSQETAPVDGSTYAGTAPR
jgi:hypothetical protein